MLFQVQLYCSFSVDWHVIFSVKVGRYSSEGFSLLLSTDFFVVVDVLMNFSVHS